MSDDNAAVQFTDVAGSAVPSVYALQARYALGLETDIPPRT